MNKLEQLRKELCPNGVEFVPLWSVTIWDKKFNSVDRKKQPKSINYPYLLAKDLFALEVENGDVFLLRTACHRVYNFRRWPFANSCNSCMHRSCRPFCQSKYIQKWQGQEPPFSSLNL